MRNLETIAPNIPHQQYLAELMPKPDLQPGSPLPESSPVGLPLVESATSQLTTPDQVIEWTHAPLNTSLNILIGNRKESMAEEPLVDALGYARMGAEVSRELALHEKGELKDDLSELAREALAAGQTSATVFESSLAQIQKFEGLQQERTKVLGFEKELGDARSTYIAELMKKPLKGRKQHKQKLAELESNYNAALLNKISSIMDIDPQHEKAPYAASEMRRIAEVAPNIEKLSDSQLHVLVDQLSREQLIKADAIEKLTNRGAKRVLNVLKTSRPLRVAIGATIWAGSLAASHKGLLPKDAEFVGDMFKQVLPLVAGYVTGREVLSGVDEGVEKFKRSRQMKKDIAVLTEDTFLTQLGLRTLYGGIEYQEGQIPGRQAGSTPEENKAAFANVNSEYAGLQAEGARGGKPYKLETALPYVADLYIRRKDQIDAITRSDDPKEAFLKLCNEVITADSKELSDRLQANRAKKALYRAMSIGGTVFANEWLGQIKDFQNMSKQPVDMAAAA